MPKGKAYGRSKDYQVLAANILRILSDHGYFPYEGDGVDVQFDMGGTTWYLDVALKDNHGNLVVAECKNWNESKEKRYHIQQDHIATFAYKVWLLREQTGVNVAALFFTKTKYQLGAVKAAEYAGIEVVYCDERQPLDGFIISFHRYDASRGTRIQEAKLYAGATLKPSGDVTMMPLYGSAPPVLTPPLPPIKLKPTKLRLNPPDLAVKDKQKAR